MLNLKHLHISCCAVFLCHVESSDVGQLIEKKESFFFFYSIGEMMNPENTNINM